MPQLTRISSGSSASFNKHLSLYDSSGYSCAMGASTREERLDQGLMAVPWTALLLVGGRLWASQYLKSAATDTVEPSCTSENLMTERLCEYVKAIRKRCLVIIPHPST